ncbi:VOC family protein [Actinoplanes sp. NPDC049596]|uniref:VOC family protein n=1 Tax=unclassified Actinoplanes TaxID=2626549 RepID=UPI00341AB5D6
MAIRLAAICFEAHRPRELAAFWGGLLGWKAGDDPLRLVPEDDAGVPVWFAPAEEAKVEHNKIHFDLTSGSAEEQRGLVERALELGGRPCDVGQKGDEGHVVLADPEGNEFCVIEPGNNFLAGCGRVGAINCDGSRALGYFWSEALGWPLVWDQDEETAIQSPYGGTKITWSGPPVSPRVGKDLFLAVAVDGAADVDRLVKLGAGRVDDRTMTDPDGNKFSVLTRP